MAIVPLAATVAARAPAHEALTAWNDLPRGGLRPLVAV